MLVTRGAPSALDTEKNMSKNVPPGHGPAAVLQPSNVTGHGDGDDEEEEGDDADKAGAGMKVMVACCMVSFDGHLAR